MIALVYVAIAAVISGAVAASVLILGGPGWAAFGCSAITFLIADGFFNIFEMLKGGK